MKWISVKDRYPEDGEYVFVAIDYQYPGEGINYDFMQYVAPDPKDIFFDHTFVSSKGFLGANEVTHWMKPEPPVKVG